MDRNSEFVSQGIHRRHVAAGTIAIVVSVGFHIGLIGWLLTAQFKVPLTRMLENQDPAIRKFLNLRELERSEPEMDMTPHDADAAVRVADLGGRSKQLEVPPQTLSFEPPALPEALAASEAPTLDGPAAIAEIEPWEPRQEIMMVESAIVRDEAAKFVRHKVPSITRVPDAADVVYPVDRTLLAAVEPAEIPGESLEPAAIVGEPSADVPPGDDTALAIDEKEAETGEDLFEETPEEVTDIKPLDNFLSAGVTTFHTIRDREYIYFRVEIVRRSDDVLPVIPKDVLFVQDCSASMAEQRLYFCREAMKQVMPRLGREDRFNVVAFRDQATFCFPTWANASSQNIAHANGFVEAFRSEGNTDIYASIEGVLGVELTPGRPVIAILVTDGHATSGLMDGSAIIREFGKRNDGKISVFTMGTIQQSHTYLLDLLSYSNRGETRAVEGGRWGIPESMNLLMDEVRNPVLADVTLAVAQATPSEIYPVQTMNLYRNRPLVLHGRCKRNQAQVTIRATGQTGEVPCDMIFTLDVREATSGKKDIRTEFGKQKVYHLISEYARTGDNSLRHAVKKTAKDFRVRIPHRGAF